MDSQSVWVARAPAVFEIMRQCPQATALPPLIGNSGLPTAAAVFVIEKEWADVSW